MQDDRARLAALAWRDRRKLIAKAMQKESVLSSIDEKNIILPRRE